MKLFDFLTTIYKTKSLPDYSVICFHGAESYPLLFFSMIISFLNRNGCCVETMNVSVHDESSIKARFATYFLGKRMVYWLPNMSNVGTNKKKWSSYLNTYHGPNTIMLFASGGITLKTDNILMIDVPNAIAPHDIQILWGLFAINASKPRRQMLNRLSDRYDTLSLDKACLISHYIVVVGKNMLSVMDTWFDNLIAPKLSLFELSQYFFAKKSQLFFTKWAQIKEQYSPPFWTTFWSEQLWRSGMYTAFTREKKFAEAQCLRFKLPFSFLNRDWRSYQSDELARAHQYIYDIDYRLKNGGNDGVLDLFYTKFLTNKFR